MFHDVRCPPTMSRRANTFRSLRAPAPSLSLSISLSVSISKFISFACGHASQSKMRSARAGYCTIVEARWVAE